MSDCPRNPTCDGCPICWDTQTASDLQRALSERDEARAQAAVMCAELTEMLVSEIPDSDARDAPTTPYCFGCETGAENGALAHQSYCVLSSSSGAGWLSPEEAEKLRAEAAVMRRALEASAVDVSAERTWCRECRTETPRTASDCDDARMTHRHRPHCCLSSSAGAELLAEAASYLEEIPSIHAVLLEAGILATRPVSPHAHEMVPLGDRLRALLEEMEGLRREVRALEARESQHRERAKTAEAVSADLRRERDGFREEAGTLLTVMEEHAHCHLAVSCLFCDWREQTASPEARREAMLRHVSECSAHPMRQLESESADLRARLERAEQRRFPIMGGPSIPWAMIAPHARQAKSNHYQSLERLAERGGLGSLEAVAVLESRSWRDVRHLSKAEGLSRLNALVAAWESAQCAAEVRRAVEEEREAIKCVILGGSFLREQAPAARFSRDVVRAIDSDAEKRDAIRARR